MPPSGARVKSSIQPFLRYKNGVCTCARADSPTVRNGDVRQGLQLWTHYCVWCKNVSKWAYNQLMTSITWLRHSVATPNQLIVTSTSTSNYSCGCHLGRMGAASLAVCRRLTDSGNQINIQFSGCIWPFLIIFVLILAYAIWPGNSRVYKKLCFITSKDESVSSTSLSSLDLIVK